MGYQIPILKKYVSEYGADVHVIHWDLKKLTPYQPPLVDGITYYKRSSLDFNKMDYLIQKINPNIVYVSGWMDKLYIKICGKLKKNSIPVVAGCDTQWNGNVKHELGRIYFRLFLKKNFSYLWVAGPYQYEYAKKLGFKNSEIIFNCLSADTDTFNIFDRTNLQHNFIFVGRLEDSKGLRILVKAWNEITDKRSWTLTIIGNGSLEKELRKEKNIILKDFLSPSLLVTEFKNSGCFILPSLQEPWALVIHEAASCSLPIIATNVCGATPVFVTQNYNGFIAKADDISSLKDKMMSIISMSDYKLLQMSKNSYDRSKVISPTISAASFISVESTNIKINCKTITEKII